MCKLNGVTPEKKESTRPRARWTIISAPPARRDGGNSRNGTRTKQLLTDVGPVEVTIPRDRDGSFEPQIVGKRQRRLSRSTDW